MKAIIMAGGEGTRLRPISSDMPKPMVRIFDRPVLGYILDLLRENGVTEVCLSLRFMPEQIREYVGDGSRFGLRAHFRTEDEPLGTAGGVKNCVGFISGDDFFVISGDAVCDFDLRRLMDIHKARRAAASIALYRCEDPLEYGLVRCDADGRIEGFVEKPSWDRVFTDLVNTGVYVLSPSVLKMIPGAERYDFSRDLFPRLIKTGSLFGSVLDGYWRDIGGCEAYLRCVMDALEGRVRLSHGAPELRQGVWSRSPLPEGVRLEAPCYIGENVRLDEGATVGPGVMLGEGTHICRGVRVTGSVVDGARIGAAAELTGAVVLRQATVGTGAMLREGSVVGEDTKIGAGAMLAERVRVWPRREIAPGTKLKGSITSGSLKSGLHFSDGCRLVGEPGVEISPELLVAAGAALAKYGTLGLASSPAEASRVAAAALMCGFNSAGGDVVESDARFEASARFFAEEYATGSAAFAGMLGDRLEICFLGPGGAPLPREAERELENAALCLEFARTPSAGVGTHSRVSGLQELYCARAAQMAPLNGVRPEGFPVIVAGKGAENRALKRSLELIGCNPGGAGATVLEVYGGGMFLSAGDPEGRDYSHDRLLTALALIELESGIGRVACAADAPAALDLLQKKSPGAILRAGRDEGGSELLSKQRFMRDGVFAACRLICGLAARGESLGELMSRTPVFVTVDRELGLRSSRAAAMRELAHAHSEFSEDFLGGLTLKNERGVVRVYPARAREALKIHAECADMEAAEELIAEIERLF